MKTTRKSKTQTATRRIGSHPRGSKARKGILTFGTIAAIAALGQLVRNRRFR